MTTNPDSKVIAALNEMGDELRHLRHEYGLTSTQVVTVLGVLMSSFTDSALDEVSGESG